VPDAFSNGVSLFERQDDGLLRRVVSHVALLGLMVSPEEPESGEESKADPWASPIFRTRKWLGVLAFARARVV